MIFKQTKLGKLTFGVIWPVVKKLERKIASVKNTQKITSAMEMVAAV